MSTEPGVLAVIGGSGLYDLPELEDKETYNLSTPYGDPSSPILSGRIGECRVLFLARHGHNHSILPSEINYRANIYALKVLGANWLLSVSAVGSLKEEIKPGDVAVPHQFTDYTRERPRTFFGDGVVAHVPFGTPVCPVFSSMLQDSIKKEGVSVHPGVNYICIEGPTFSTRAESNIYRSFGADIIGMTNLPEARLAREAEISYATFATVSDYDCWRGDEEDVDVSKILGIIKKNVGISKKVILSLSKQIPKAKQPDLVVNALKHSILTSFDKVPGNRLDELEPIIGKYVST